MSSLVSGYEFSKLCKWSICPRYPSYFDVLKIQENDLVFLNFDYFNIFIQVLQAHNPIHKIIVIVHNSDTPFTDDYMQSLRPYVHKVYAINNVCESACTIPIGFVDNIYKPHTLFHQLLSTPLPKDIFVYMNFSVKTNEPVRSDCLNTFHNKEWVTEEYDVDFPTFCEKISRSKYVLSPEGAGMDCHRIYESLFLGAIPLLRTSKLDTFYKKLPVLIFNSWSDITEQFLTDNYELFANNLADWKKNNPNWYTAEFWII